MSGGMGAVAHALPHTELNHFLSRTKKLLASGGVDNQDAVYVVTRGEPSLDQAVAAIGFAYLQQRLDENARVQRRYVPVLSVARHKAAPELGLALQTAVVAEENVVFEDDEVYRTVNAYTSKKKVVLVGGAGEQRGVEGWTQWQELHGAELFGIIDTENTLPTEIHDEQGGVNQRLPVALLPLPAVRTSGEPEPSLCSLVALWAKQQVSHESRLITRELADLLLAAILLETDNLAESKTNSADLGAIGWLTPHSSFQLPHQEHQASSAPPSGDEEANIANESNLDAFVPTFPDLGALYRALRAASRPPLPLAATGGFESVSGDTLARDEGETAPVHFQWNLITNTMANLDEEHKSGIPEFVSKTIHGDFAALLTSPLAMQLFKPIGEQLGRCLGDSDSDGNNRAFDLAALQKPLQQALETGVTGEAQAYQALCIAISALHAFVQINWTGPELPEALDPLGLLRTAAPDAFPPRPVDADQEDRQNSSTNRLIHRASLQALAFKGEPAYHLCQVPFFLVVSKLIIEALWNVQTHRHGAFQIETLAWWRLRAFTVHSHVLDEPVPFGKKVFDPVNKLRDTLVARAAACKLTSSGMQVRGAWDSLTSRLILERGIALQRLGNDREASETFVDAAKENGLQYRMSGAMGKRTKFQKEDRTQLVLLAKSVVADGGKEDEEAEETAGSSQDKHEASVPTIESEPDKQQIETGFASKANPEDQVAGMPSTFALNDDTLLEQTKFTSTAGGVSTDAEADADQDDLGKLDPNAQPALAVLDQCILLALCLNIRNTQAAHGLTANQMQIFISRVVAHPRNWMVHTMSLLLRARLEATRTRTVERSVLQLQALIDQMPTNDSSIQERLKFFHALDLPPKWEMQAELARRYASIGVTRSALEIFERVEMWEEVVQCLGMLGRQEEGVEVVRELLEGKKVEADVDVSVRRRTAAQAQGGKSEAQQVMYTRLDRAREAKLWCLLGDLEPASALAHYAKAWEVSSSSSARAARSLGGVHFSRNEFGEAAKWLKLALRINPLYTRSWFILGCCYMRLEKWKEGAQCFRRCTALDDEDMESWNNLASCYLRMVEDASTSAASDAVGIERMGAHGGLPDILEAEEEAERMWDDTGAKDEYDDGEGDTDSAGLSDWSGSSRSDSGVEVSSSESEAGSETTATETETGLPDPGVLTGTASRSRRRPNAASATTAYSLKLLAHRSLQQSLRFAHDNWRVWYNYMIVCVDVGYLLEATRALARVTQLQTRHKTNDVEKAKTVDLSVLARLVDAVTRTPKAELEARALAQMETYEAAKHAYDIAASQGVEQGAAPLVAPMDVNSGLGLYPAVRRLFDETLLGSISTSAAIWKLYARVLLWNGEQRRAVQHALLQAYHSALNAALNNDDGGGDLQSDKTTFVALLHDLRNLVDALLQLAEQRQDGADDEAPSPRFQARSLVRTFLAKTRTSWEDQPEYDEAKQLLEQLKS